MSKQNTPHQKEQSPIERISAFIEDKRKAFYLAYIGVAIFCVFSSGWVSLDALERVKEALSGYDLYITGDTGSSDSASLDAEMQVVMVVAVVIALSKAIPEISGSSLTTLFRPGGRVLHAVRHRQGSGRDFDKGHHPQPSERFHPDAGPADELQLVSGQDRAAGGGFGPVRQPSSPLAARFLGNNHTISGLSLTNNGSHQGLFRYLQPSRQVTNLTVRGTVAPGGSAGQVGGIVGVNETTGRVTGCQSGLLFDCSNGGHILGRKDVGGVDGISYAGHAQSAELSFLQALEGVPTEFTSFRLILRADGRVIQTIPLPSGSGCRR